MKKRLYESAHQKQYIIISAIVSLVLVVMFVRSITHSLFFSRSDRINVLFYQDKPIYYSLGVADTTDYMVSIAPDAQLQIPGGYGTYRAGALGKLVNLEKKPDLYKRTFSYTTSTMLNYYFYPKTASISFGTDGYKLAQKPSLKQILFSSTNAGWLDRLYLAFLFSQKPIQHITVMDFKTIKDKQGDLIFPTEEFSKQYQAYLYQKEYRDEQKTIQIRYATHYSSALALSAILEGSGMRVSDISQQDQSQKRCIIMDSSKSFSQTALALSSFIPCNLEKKDTGIYNIIIELGEKEGDWEVK